MGPFLLEPGDPGWNLMKLQYKHLRPLITSMRDKRSRYFKIDRAMHMALNMEEDAAEELGVRAYILDRTQNVYITEINGFLELVDHVEDIQPPFKELPVDYINAGIPMSVELKELYNEGRITYKPVMQSLMILLSDERDKLLTEMEETHAAMVDLWNLREPGGDWPDHDTPALSMVALQLIDDDTGANSGDPLMLAGSLSHVARVAENNSKHTGMFYRVSADQEMAGTIIQADRSQPLAGMSKGILFGEWYGLPLYRVTPELPPQMSVSWVELLERIGTK